MPTQSPAPWLWWKGGPGEVARVSITQQGAQPQHTLWYLGSEAVRTAEPCPSVFSLCVLFCNVITNEQPIPKSESTCDLLCNDVGVNPQGSRDGGLAFLGAEKWQVPSQGLPDPSKPRFYFPRLGPIEQWNLHDENPNMKDRDCSQSIHSAVWRNEQERLFTLQRPPPTPPHIVSIRKHSARKHTPPVFHRRRGERK